MEFSKELLDTIKKGTKSSDPKVIILMGLPGSGKSYVADYLNKKYGFTALSGENISNALFENDRSTDYVLVYQILRQIAAELLVQGYSVVIDGTNLKYFFRKQIYDEVCRNIRPILIHLIVDDHEAIRRITARGVDNSDSKNIKSMCSVKTFQNFKSQLELPTSEEHFHQLNSDSKLLANIDTLVKNL